MQFKARPQALKVALIYVIAAGGWILFSDKLMQLLVGDPETRIQLSILKGWGFVLVTGGLLFVSVQRLLRRWERAAEQHRQSERFLQSALDALTSHIAILDEHGTIINVNAAWDHFARENGLNGSHTLGGNYLRVCDSATGDASAGAAAVAAGIRKVMAGQSDLFKSEYPCHSPQTQRWFVVRVTRFAGAEPVRVVVAHENITARKLAEVAVRESEEKYRGLFVGSHDAIMTLDPATGRFTSGNPASVELFAARNEAEFMARSPADLSPEQQPDGSVSAQAARTMMEIAHREGTHFFEWRHRRLNGEEFSANVRLTRMELRGKPVVMAIVRDITERKLVEAQLRESQAHLVLMAEAAPVLIWEAGTDKLCYHFNQVWLTFTGRTLAQEQGNGWAEGVHPDDLARCLDIYTTNFDARREFKMEYRLRRHDGEYRWLLDHGVPRYLPDGSFTGYIGSCLDITEHKQAAAALKQERNLLRTLVDHLPDMIYVRDTANRFLIANEAIARRMGTNPAGLIGRTDTDFYPAEIAACFAATDRTILSGGEILNHECRVAFPNGEELEVVSTKVPLKTTAGEVIGLVGIIHDITERKLAEEALKQITAMLQLVLDTIPQYVCWKDRDSRFLGCNQNYANLVGLANSQAIVGKTDADLPWTAAETDFFIKVDRRIMAADRAEYQIVEPARDAQGRTIWLETNKVPLHDAAGKVNGILIAFQDITERKRAEDQMQVQLSALSAAANGIVITDRQGKIEWVNPSFTQLTGYASDEVVGHNPRLWKSDQHPRTFFATLWATITTGNVWHGEIINKRKDGKHYTEEATITPVRGADGQIAHFVAVKQDVTERRLLENQLRQAQKLEAVGTLAGGIAHDFNNILGAIISFTELTKMDLPADGELQENLNEVLTASQRATALVRQILTFSRQQPKLERRSLQLTPVIKEALKLMRATLPSTIDIEQAIAANLPDVLADPTQMHQVMMNLCTNAAHAMRGQQGRLRVELALLPLDSARPSSLPALAAGDYVRMVISDTGHGMEAAVLERIFEPFFTTKGPGEGTGLGLSVVHGIVQDHEGVLAVASELGRGTTFTIYLPALPAPETPVAEVGVAIPPGHGERILFVDDEPMLGGAARRIIQLLGYQPTVFSRPKAAWDEISGHPADYDLLITDLTMPGMTGLELAEKVLKLRPELPVILMSGDSGSLTQAQLQALGITQLLHKPLNHQMLAQAIHQALPKRLNQRISTD